MIVALVLLGFACLASTIGTRALSRAAWPSRAPAWGIWVWQTLSGSVAAAVVLTGVALGVPELPLRGDVAEVLRACSLALTRHYETPGGAPVAIMALVMSALLVLRFWLVLGVEIRGARRARGTHLDAVSLVSTDDPDGYKVIEHRAPMIYCLPGRTRTVVVTSSARDLLSPRQLALVLQHEQAHLRLHHHIALTTARALCRTFAGARVFRVAQEAIAELVEMQADDSAHRSQDRRDLARALVTLNPAQSSPAATLSSGGGGAVRRVQRLVQPPGQGQGGTAWAAGLTGISFVLAPLLLLLAPAMEASLNDCCPFAAFGEPGSSTERDHDQAGR